LDVALLTSTKPAFSALAASSNNRHTLLDDMFSQVKYELMYSEKFERYKYWLKVNGKMPEHIEFTKNEQ
jgi:hypothetical protein